jgi:HKD family nuclease
MAKLELLLQAATDATHVAALRKLLSDSAAERALISVGFVREAGVEAVESALRPLAASTEFFIGIRNDITSIQGVKRLLATKVKVYAVDTGSRDTIFHPKLYFVAGKQKAGLIVGSANLTFQGLHNNIEVSGIISLDFSNDDDRSFKAQIFKAFKDLSRLHPQHVFLIKDDSHADELFLAGRLADERVEPAPTTTSALRKSPGDGLPRMKLKRVFRPRIKTALKKLPASGTQPIRSAETSASAVSPPTQSPTLPVGNYYLVWESKDLTERDLNVPTGANTNRTGSMLLKKGAFENIDQRAFFRSEIFEDLQWGRDPNKPHLERAVASFELVVRNVNYGKFRLRLTHNTNTRSRSYLQNNAMTSLHWGDVAAIVRQRDLLGRIFYLYRKDTLPPEFMIEID